MRDYADKIVRDALLNPENLRDLLRARVPELVGGFDFKRVSYIPNKFLLPDGRGREADLIFEIPYRIGEEERIAFVCILIEHQTRADLRMPLRTLLYIVLYWEKKWLEWENQPSPKPEFRLPPVLPIVFHTGTQPWGATGRSIADLLDEPQGFHQFAPVWTPLFWELSQHSVDELLSADDALLHVLAVVRVEDAEQDEFERVLRDAVKRFFFERGTDRISRVDLLYFMLGWITHRRPAAEHSGLRKIVEDLVTNPAQREEMKNMVQSYADVLLAEGEAKGEARGETRGARKILVRLGNNRLGPANADVITALGAIEDFERLERMIERVHEATSWADLLGAP